MNEGEENSYPHYYYYFLLLLVTGTLLFSHWCLRGVLFCQHLVDSLNYQNSAFKNVAVVYFIVGVMRGRAKNDL